MGADRPGDADMPPEDHPDRRDDQNGTGDHAAHGGNDRAETRTRQEYYSELRVTVSREESAVERQTMAEERAAGEKWQETTAESRWIWSEYQRKWPPAERPVGRQIQGSVGLLARGQQQVLGVADNNRVDAECDHIARREEEKISPALRAIESQDPDRHLVGFEHRLKGRDRIKEKVYDSIKLLNHCPQKRLYRLVSDTIRYTFQYRESRYTQGVWTDIERLKGEGFELHKLKNSWSDDEYKGINSHVDRAGHRPAFRSAVSHAYQLRGQAAHPHRLRTDSAASRPMSSRRLVLEAFQKKGSS